MKKAVAVLAVAMCFALPVMAEQYESPMAFMEVPSGLEQNQMYVSFGHMMYRTLHDYPADDVFAVLNGGANMEIQLRYMVWEGFEAAFSYISHEREKKAGVSWNSDFEKLMFSARVSAEYFSFRNPLYDAENGNIFWSLALQSAPLFDDRVRFALDAGYDGFHENPGVGLGVSVNVIKGISVQAEYFPLIRTHADNASIGNTGCFAFGVKLETYGHQFKLKFANSTAMDMRSMMLGSGRQDVYAGFEIMRLVAF